MASIKLILNQDVQNLGTIGEVVNVKAGYARNYLLPRGFGVMANAKNEAELNHRLRVLEKKKAALLADAKKIASAIEKVSVTVSKQVGEEEKIFGSVTTHELAELLGAEGVKVDRKDITITDDIKKVGVYSAQVKLHSEVVAKFKVWVVAQ
jgi:large subunit ribosomal protein L9